MVWFAALTAANPVTLYQSLSYYVDGSLGALLTAIAAVSLLLFLSPTKTLAALWIMLGVLAINLKFTGVPYLIIAGVGLVLMAVANRRWSLAVHSVQLLTVTLVSAVVIVGYNPYIGNTVDHGHPFYPVRGDHAIDIMTPVTPKGLQEGGRMEKFLTALFSDSTNAMEFTPQAQPLALLPPATSITGFANTDMRVGGWGPLFGRIVALLGVGLLLCLLVMRPVSNGRLVAGACAIILVSVLANPEAWWARYTPQLWLIPLSLGVWLFLQSSKVARGLGVVTLSLLSLNTLLVAGAYFSYNQAANAELKTQLVDLAKSTAAIQVDFGPFAALRERLAAAGVPFETVPTTTLQCNAPLVLLGTFDKVWLCRE
ncbi:MAG: hypothetical protein FD130_793 [Halothiobacillaceae bacterium]|nr:MAG: hypothetical protein FD130_793 [Halothiobacillaceae bacterium]